MTRNLAYKLFLCCIFFLLSTCEGLCKQASPTKPPQGEPSEAQTMQSGARQEQARELIDEITSMRKEIAALREQQNQVLASRADSTMATANTIVQYSALVLTLFTVTVTALLGTAGFLGFRELRKIREIGTAAKEDIQRLIEGFRGQLDTQKEDLSNQIREQSETLEAHRASVDAELQKQILRVDNESKVLEGQLDALMKRYEQESRTFMEASYNFSMGERAYRESDFSAALMYFKRAEDFRPKDLNVLTRIARSNIELGDESEARCYFEKALELDPNSALVLRKAATLYRYDDLERAIEYAERAAKTDSEDCEAFDYLGLLYRDKKDFEAAISSHEKALSIRVRPETYFFLCLLYAQKGDFSKAKEVIDLGNSYLEREALHPTGYQTRELWKQVIKFAQSVLEGDQQKAIKIAEEMHQYITTSRSRMAIRNHLVFLLNALDRDEAAKAILFNILGLEES